MWLPGDPFNVTFRLWHFKQFKRININEGFRHIHWEELTEMSDFYDCHWNLWSHIFKGYSATFMKYVICLWEVDIRITDFSRKQQHIYIFNKWTHNIYTLTHLSHILTHLTQKIMCTNSYLMNADKSGPPDTNSTSLTELPGFVMTDLAISIPLHIKNAQLCDLN